jgi:hypothetical protein
LPEERGFGPGFQSAKSRLYRAEWGGITLVLLGYIVWRALYAGGIDILQTLFWAAFPDLMAFIPIGLASRERRWPEWGASIYNVVHTLLLPGAILLVLVFVLGTVYLPLLGWLLHITADRALGFGLRRRKEWEEK